MRGQALEEFRTVRWARVRGGGGPEVGFRELVFIYFRLKPVVRNTSCAFALVIFGRMHADACDPCD